MLDETTADLAFLLILGAARLASDAERDLRSGVWDGWEITEYLGVDVHGATLGIVGLGRIGQAVARRAAGFGMRVHPPHAARHRHPRAGPATSTRCSRRRDFVSLHTPLNDETRHLIDARRLALMKPTAVLVNTARGPVVDEVALGDALHEGRLFAAGIDVYEYEPMISERLLSAPRAMLLPHLGSASVATRTRMAHLACEGAIAVLAGTTPPNLVRL